MELEQPFEPRWRAGRLSIGYEEERDQFLLEIEEFRPELEERRSTRAARGRAGGAAPAREPGPDVRARPGTRRPSWSAAGRPASSAAIPLDPEGHACPGDERTLQAGLTDPRVPAALATGELEILGLLPNSSNYTFLARCDDG